MTNFEARFEVIVQPKPGVRDPQSDAMSAAMMDSGYQGCRALSVGRFLSLSVTAADPAQAAATARALCESMLVNPLLETYVLRAVQSPPAPAGHPEGQP